MQFGLFAPHVATGGRDSPLASYACTPTTKLEKKKILGNVGENAR